MEHIGRLVQFGLGTETVASGTPVAPSAWLKKVTGTLMPMADNVDDEASIGTIGPRLSVQKTRKHSVLSFSGTAHFNDLGHLLKPTFGSAVLTVPCALGGIAGGTPAVGDTVSIVDPAMTGVIEYIAEGFYFIRVTGGTFNATSNTETLTNGTWTATVSGVDNAVFGHIFKRLNNNNHPSSTLYGYDPVDPQRATYGMMNNFNLEFASEALLAVSGDFLARKILDDATGSTPSYDVNDRPFIGRQTAVKFASTVSALDSASSEDLRTASVSVAKNVTNFHAIGSDEDASLHNQQFDVTGTFEALFNSLDYQNFDQDNTSRAMRFYVNATDFTIGASSTPKLLLDFSNVNFVDFGKSDDANGLATQTLGYRVNEVLDTATSQVVVAVLVNSRTTAY